MSSPNFTTVILSAETRPNMRNTVAALWVHSEGSELWCYTEGEFRGMVRWMLGGTNRHVAVKAGTAPGSPAMRVAERLEATAAAIRSGVDFNIAFDEDTERYLAEMNA